jgi:hypothetical protein
MERLRDNGGESVKMFGFAGTWALRNLQSTFLVSFASVTVNVGIDSREFSCEEMDEGILAMTPLAKELSDWTIESRSRFC